MNVAFVTPFFGEHAAGGAESECRQTALRLAARGIRVDILTTCLLDLQHDWNIDAFPAGVSTDEGLTVRRFRSEKVDRTAFDRLNTPLMHSEQVAPEHAEQFAALHINSFDLLRYLAAHVADYDWVCFIPYLFGTSIHGSKLCPEKAVLIPCLHDEGYARLAPVNAMFKRVDRIVFHTPAEERLAQQCFGSLTARCAVIGEGVDTDLEADADRFRKTFGITSPFVLYCGRKDSSKNTPELIDHFTRYASGRDDETALVLIGPGSVPIPPTCKRRIIDLGFVSRQEKLDAYAAASVFCQPSLNESFSIVLMEAWDLGRPVLVNGRCEVLRDHVVAAGGGLYYEDAATFSACLDHLLTGRDAVRMGEAGRAYVRDRFAWNTIIDRYTDTVFASK